MNVLITGMAGTGKSTLAEYLDGQGYQVVDADDGYANWVRRSTGEHFEDRPDGSHIAPDDFVWHWQKEPVTNLLAEPKQEPLLFFGISDNQASFYPLFNLLLVLDTDNETILHRLRERTNNPFGKRPGDIERVVEHLGYFRQLMQQAGAISVNASLPIEELATEVVRIIGENRRLA